jgi:hypothetical protein
MNHLLRTSLCIFGFLLLFYLTRPIEVSCTEDVTELRREQIALVIIGLQPSGKEFIASGYNPINKRKADYHPRGGSWYSYLFHQLQIGDTLEKTLGTNFFLIKKKDYNLSVPYACGEDSFAIAEPAIAKLPKNIRH